MAARNLLRPLAAAVERRRVNLMPAARSLAATGFQIQPP